MWTKTLAGGRPGGCRLRYPRWLTAMPRQQRTTSTPLRFFFLSIEVINVLGASNLGLHVEEAPVSWERLQAGRENAALVNWNKEHWTLLNFEEAAGIWVHTNSVIADGPHHGRVRCSTVDEVATILATIERDRGAYSLHRIKRTAPGAGAEILEAEGFCAMTGPEAVEADLPEEHGARNITPASGAELSIVTVNVDGLGAYLATSQERMREILTVALDLAPDMLLLQEVTAEMFEVAQEILKGWTVRRRRQTSEDYFLAVAVGPAQGEETARITSYPFVTSKNGRHLLTVRQDGWTVVNVHAESGRRQEERDERGPVT